MWTHCACTEMIFRHLYAFLCCQQLQVVLAGAAVRLCNHPKHKNTQPHTAPLQRDCCTHDRTQ